MSITSHPVPPLPGTIQHRQGIPEPFRSDTLHKTTVHQPHRPTGDPSFWCLACTHHRFHECQPLCPGCDLCILGGDPGAALTEENSP